MVDFTAVINNEDMVKGLNHLIRRNADVLDGLEAAAPRDDATLQFEVTQLKDMHERHIGRLGDTVRALGGAPVADGDWRGSLNRARVQAGKLGTASGEIAALRSQETKLKAIYERNLARLKTSPEAVAVIRDLLEEELRCLDHLQDMSQGSDTRH